MASSGRKVPPPMGSRPCLVYSYGRGGKNQIFCCNVSEPSMVQTHYDKSIPSLNGKKVLTCSQGWLVLSDYNNKRLSLCNSITFDTITLPCLKLSPENNKIDSCILSSSSPDCPDFKVLLFLKDVPIIMCCSVGDVEWSEIKYEKQVKALINPRQIDHHLSSTTNSTAGTNLCFSQPVSCGGKIYARLRLDGCLCRAIISIKIVGKSKRLVLPKLKGPRWNNLLEEQCSYCVDEYLLESNGELFLVLFMWGDEQRNESHLVVEISRLDFDTMVWERVKSINDQAFFICENYCLSYYASESGNCVYFTKNGDPSLYCYNIGDDSILTHLPCPDLPEPLLSSPIWIMPHQLDFRLKGGTEYSNQGKHEHNTAGFEFVEEQILSGPSLMDLPFDILELIPKYLINPLDYMNFREVNTICRSVAPLIDWKMTLLGSETNNIFSFPLLMFARKDEGVYKFIDPRRNSKYSYMMEIPNDLEDTIVSYSYHGWLLMSSRRGNAVHIYNPFSGGLFRFPARRESESKSKESFFSGSKPSGAADFLANVAFVRSPLDPCIVVVSTLEFGENEWTYIRLPFNRRFEATGTNPVFFQDAFYFLDKNGNLGRLRFQENMTVNWEFLQKPRKPACSNSSNQNFLVECGGELLSVFVERLGKWLFVYKLNQSEGAWEAVNSLSNYALYLSRTSSFSVSTSPDWGNKIYFPSLRGSGIVFFSLDTGKWHSSGSQDSSSDLYGTISYLRSCWIKPS